MSGEPTMQEMERALAAANALVASQAQAIKELQAQNVPWFTMHRAAEALRAEPEIALRLRVFMDNWGLDAYTPPPDVEKNVRDLVHAFLLAAGEREGGGVSETSTLNGFIICGPGFPVEAGYHTFGRTMAEAWERHIRKHGREVGEVETLRHRWAQKGWRPIPAQLVIPIPEPYP